MFPFNFVLTNQSLEVRVGSWVARRIYYSDMESARPGSSFWNEHWNNFWPLEFITIRRKSGFMRNFVINPPDRENFITGLLMRINSQAVPLTDAN